MRVPISWLREYAPIPEPYDALEVGRRLTLAGLEVEAVEQVGHDVRGVITAQVMTIEELTELQEADSLLPCRDERRRAGRGTRDAHRRYLRCDQLQRG